MQGPPGRTQGVTPKVWHCCLSGWSGGYLDRVIGVRGLDRQMGPGLLWFPMCYKKELVWVLFQAIGGSRTGNQHDTMCVFWVEKRRQLGVFSSNPDKRHWQLGPELQQ